MIRALLIIGKILHFLFFGFVFFFQYYSVVAKICFPVIAEKSLWKNVLRKITKDSFCVFSRNSRRLHCNFST